jgi:hypothetical protein
MSETERLIHASVDDVFAVLTDGWSYASWPQPGHSIHHSVGAWPLLLDDTTTVVRYEPLRLLELKVRAWPTGEGTVEFVATSKKNHCHLVMREQMTKGPATIIPKAVADPILNARNEETLQRLALLAEGRH